MTEKIFDNELIEKAKEAKSAEELLAMAKAEGVELTEEQAKEYFARLNPASGEMSDDELNAVAGGGCGGSSEEKDRFLGKYVKRYNGGCKHCTVEYNNFLVIEKETGFSNYLLRCQRCANTMWEYSINLEVVS